MGTQSVAFAALENVVAVILTGVCLFIVTDVRLLQPSKASLAILSISSPRITVVMEVMALNHELTVGVCKVTEARLVQPSKAKPVNELLSIVVSVEGRVILVRFVQL